MDTLQTYKEVVKILFQIGAYSLGIAILVTIVCLGIGYLIGAILMANDNRKKNSLT